MKIIVIVKDGMGGACRTSTKFRLGNLKGRDHSEDLGIYGRKKVDLKGIVWEGVDWIHLAQERPVLKFWIP
jgi:hypothetical protein